MKTGVTKEINKHNTCGKVGKQMKKKTTTKQAGNVGREEVISLGYKSRVSIVKRNGDCIRVPEKTSEQIDKFLDTYWDNDCIGLIAGANGDSYQIRANYCDDQKNEQDNKGIAISLMLCTRSVRLETVCDIAKMFNRGECLYAIATASNLTPMAVRNLLADMGLVNDVESRYLESLVTFSAPASLSVLNRGAVAA